MSYNRAMTKVLEALGLNPDRHLPREGHPRTTILDFPDWRGKPMFYAASTSQARSVMVWVSPAKVGRTYKSSQHRVMCECPHCGDVLSAGRLHQHVGTDRCYQNWRRSP